MKLQTFAVYDQCARVFQKPFFLHNKNEAIRGFADAVADDSTMLAKHPEDYVLFHVGEWEDDSGTIVPKTPNKVITALECVPEDKSE